MPDVHALALDGLMLEKLLDGFFFGVGFGAALSLLWYLFM